MFNMIYFSLNIKIKQNINDKLDSHFKRKKFCGAVILITDNIEILRSNISYFEDLRVPFKKKHIFKSS